MQIKLMEKVNLPAWAVYPLTYGDDESLSTEELNLIEKFTIDKESLTLDVKSEERFFSNSPEFGLPCDCVECDVYVHTERVCIDYFPQKEKLLDWQKRGLSFTASGYGKAIPTSKTVFINGRWRRVYCTIFSNAGTCWVNINGGKVVLY